MRDGELVELWETNYRVYGVRKLWKAARRAGIMIGRDQTARLMKLAGIEGARRLEKVKTTRPDPASARHPDLVQREFTATAPNRLWVTDLTFVPTWAGVAYVCARVRHTGPGHTKVRSVTQSRFGAVAVNSRCAGSGCRADAGSGRVVLTFSNGLALRSPPASWPRGVLVTADHDCPLPELRTP